MPFVPEEHREDGHTPCTPGDLCYKEYLQIIRAWKVNPRWTTAHEEFKRVFDVSNEQAAKTLAYLVFFCKEVMPYEYKKCEENGDIH